MNRFILLFFIPSLSFAFFCPSNFSQINIGDSLDQVQKACGNPDAKTEKEVQPEGRKNGIILFRKPLPRMQWIKPKAH